MTRQRINCTVKECVHHGQDNCCDLSEIKVASWEGQYKQNHESQCSNFESK